MKTNEKTSKTEKVQHQNWSLINVQTREVASTLNKLSREGNTIFSVLQSTHIGGSYEVLYFNYVGE